MIFLFTVVLIVSCTAWMAFGSRSEVPSLRLLGERLIFCIGVLLVVAPMWLEFHSIALFMGAGVPVGGHLMQVMLLGLGAMLCGGLHGARVWRDRSTGTLTPIQFGCSVLAALACAYLLAAIADHFLFIRPWDEKAGVANVGALTSVKDVSCSSGFVLVHDFDPTDSDAAAYRCPAPDSFPLARFSSAPFVPWPSYTAGESAQLAAALKDIHEQAVKLPDGK